ncbi:tRNA (uracil-5-)-methyltransferase [Pseudomonas sp. MT-1]|nr:tRNA (uracil-5-)-methyltransferase [Pseudomonas sp. MT-1]
MDEAPAARPDPPYDLPTTPRVPMSAPQFDPATYDAQLAEKAARLVELLTPFDAPAPDVFDSPREHYRLRTEFRLWREDGQRHYAMFEQGDKHTPILIDSFPIASRRINELMPQLKAAWQASETLSFKLFQVEFLTTLSGDALITLAYHRPLDDAWQTEAEQLAEKLGVSIVGRSKGKRIVIGRDYVTEQLTVAGRTFNYRQPEGAFTQPNGDVCQKMLNWAYEVLGERSDDLLELYCGNGNFTLPLATRVPKVLATEISKSSVNAALANLDDNGIDNVSLVRLSAEELTQALNEVRPFRRLAGIDLKSYAFGSVFVDPPRAGMDPDTCELTRRFERILYISCNPETLAANIAQLHDTHRIERCALFDQFPYTHHMESGVLLVRR